MKLVLLFLAFLPGLARAEAFVIQSYAVDIRVEKNAVLDITERLTVKFSGARHGIIRKIPTRYTMGAVPDQDRADRPWGTGSTYSTLISGIAVQGWPFSTSRQGDYELVKIGSGNRTVTGVQEYKISYRLFGAVNFFRDHSELYWNIVGTEWDVPVERASFVVHLPGAASLSPADYAIFTGYRGAQGKAATVDFDGSILSGATTEILNSGEGLTVLARFPQGYLTNGSMAETLRLLLANNPLLPVPFLAFLLCFLLWWYFGRDQQFAIAAAWELPPGLTPAEAGYLVDDSLDTSDLTAMIYYWGSLGYLKIEEIETKGIIFNGKDYLITRLMPLPPTARGFEKILFSGLFGSAMRLDNEKASVTLTSLHNKFYLTLQSAHSSLVGEKKSAFYKFGSIELGGLMRLLALVIPGAMFYAAANDFGSIASGLVCAGLTSLVLFLFGRIMPKKSEVGQQNYRAVMGFKEFVERVEKPRLEQILKADPNYFDKMLAYAIVLGVAEHWAAKFEGLSVPPPTWYYGMDPFSPRGFVGSMNRGMSTMSQTFASQPSQAASGGSGFSSGGFGGGGGSSGGGFGGGGGSSW